MTDDISVSFKAGGSNNYDQDLLNFKGASGQAVKARLIEFFELGTGFVDCSPFEVFVEAQRVAKAVYSLGSKFGAQIVPADLSANPVRLSGSTQARDAAKPATLPAVQPEPAKPSTANVEPSDPTGWTKTDGKRILVALTSSQPHADLIAEINQAADKDAVMALYGKNKAVWSGDVAKAATARLKEIKG